MTQLRWLAIVVVGVAYVCLSAVGGFRWAALVLGEVALVGLALTLLFAGVGALMRRARGSVREG